MPRDAGIPAILAFRRLFQDDDLGSEIVGGDGRGKPGRAEPDDNDIGFDIPLIAAPKVHARSLALSVLNVIPGSVMRGSRDVRAWA